MDQKPEFPHADLSIVDRFTYDAYSPMEPFRLVCRECIGDHEQLCRWIKGWYADTSPITDQSVAYTSMIQEAIKAHDVVALALLWEGMYFGGDSPDIREELMFIAKVGSVSAFEYGLYAHAHHQQKEDVALPTPQELYDNAVSNPEVREHIKEKYLGFGDDIAATYAETERSRLANIKGEV